MGQNKSYVWNLPNILRCLNFLKQKKMNFRFQLNLKKNVMWKGSNEIKHIVIITQPVLPRLLWMQGRFFIA